MNRDGPYRVGQVLLFNPTDDEPLVYVVSRIDPDGRVFVRQQHIHHIGPEIPLDEVVKPDAD